MKAELRGCGREKGGGPVRAGSNRTERDIFDLLAWAGPSESHLVAPFLRPIYLRHLSTLHSEQRSVCCLLLVVNSTMEIMECLRGGCRTVHCPVGVCVC